MRRAFRPAALLAALIVTVALAGCGGPKFRKGSLEPEGGYPPSISDERPLVAQVTALDVEPTAGGIIIRATGLPPTQGYWQPGLLNVTDENSPKGTLVYEFRAWPPMAPAPVGGEGSRRLETAAYASNVELQGIGTITVQGAQNSRSVRR